eukprot:363776-Pyramimonas_sp.AAC.2
MNSERTESGSHASPPLSPRTHGTGCSPGTLAYSQSHWGVQSPGQRTQLRAALWAPGDDHPEHT